MSVHSCTQSTNLVQAGLDVREVRANRTKMQRTALTALEPLVFPRISTEIAVVLAAAVDGMLLGALARAILCDPRHLTNDATGKPHTYGRQTLWAHWWALEGASYQILWPYDRGQAPSRG